MNRLRSFLLAWRIARSLETFSFKMQPKWDRTKEGMALSGFLASPTGRRLLAILDWRRAQHICAATLPNPSGGRDYAAGYAAGFNDYFAVLSLLSARVQPQQDALNEDPPGDGSDIEHLSP